MERSKLIVKLPGVRPENSKTSSKVPIFNKENTYEPPKTCLEKSIQCEPFPQSKPISIISIIPSIPKKTDILSEFHNFSRLSNRDDLNTFIQRFSDRIRPSSETKFAKSPKNSHIFPMILTNYQANCKIKELFTFKNV
ncbi:hypothetical protein SteCoe_29808 [Stentor coeruleus]|uniref:Uncharacterized protein n=1 Tax=Stentor coeruleus TaxID=5963 RepID=A0A1R2B500_9CILI|nr:hypothetical protein SteCoe_29808 [Stentor coeruleus]